MERRSRLRKAFLRTRRKRSRRSSPKPARWSKSSKLLTGLALAAWVREKNAGESLGAVLPSKLTPLPPTRGLPIRIRWSGRRPKRQWFGNCSRKRAEWRQARNAGTQRPIDARPKRLTRRPGDLVSQGALRAVWRKQAWRASIFGMNDFLQDQFFTGSVFTRSVFARSVLARPDLARPDLVSPDLSESALERQRFSLS